MKNRIEEVLEEQKNNLEGLKNGNYANQVMEVTKKIVDSLKNGGKIMIAGNGGSAADAQHFAAEIIGRFKMERKGMAAIALTTDSSILTCMGNDYGYDSIFSRQVEGLGKENDVFIGISTSGNSQNIIEAVNKAKEQNIYTVGLLGKDGGKLKDMCDESFVFSYSETARVQEHHIMTIHLLCEFIEQQMVEFQK